MVIIKIRKYHHAISGQKLQKKYQKFQTHFYFSFFYIELCIVGEKGICHLVQN